MENALAEIVKERDRIEKQITVLNDEIDGFKERITYRFEKITEYQQLLSEYDQIIEKLKGVTV